MPVARPHFVVSRRTWEIKKFGKKIKVRKMIFLLVIPTV